MGHELTISTRIGFSMIFFVDKPFAFIAVIVLKQIGLERKKTYHSG